jgi:hypothetical protein
MTADRLTTPPDRANGAWSYEEPARVDPWRTWLPPLVVGLVLLVGSLAAGWIWSSRPGGQAEVGGEMSGMAAGLPAVVGYADGQAVAFVHTEASDPQVAVMLGQMMDSPVLVVPQLADVPNDVLGAVFVFSNGVEPDGPRGPFGFQPDVFDSIPGDAGYRPLRQIHLVSWRAGVTPRLLRSADEIAAAGSAGELTIEMSSTVVNMPMLRWPGGNR